MTLFATDDNSLFSVQREPLDLAARLNPAQFKAATYEGGPLLIVAGAGSGKTRTLVHRVAYLVEKGVHPASILLLTFTRKAAQEMLSRAAGLVGNKASQVAGGTFHSLANNIIRPYAHLLEYPANFTIMDQDDAESLLARLRADEPEVKRHKRFPQKGALLNIISQAVNKDKPLATVLVDSFPHFLEYAPLIEKLALLYGQHKRDNGLMDFDDLLVGLEKIMRENESARQAIAGRYEYILVDEYQDTNPIQARLTYLLGKDHLRVTAVGDDAQSIYAFRGASFRNIMDFPKIFTGTQIFKLEENYRSLKPILKVANHLISQAREKYEKELVAVRGDGAKPQMVAVSDQAAEAVFVVNKISEFIENGLALDKIAVLFRAASHSFDLEVELVRRRIPFTKYGGRKFLEAAHIKDYLAFLRCCANPRDTLSLRRILNLVEGIGPKGAQDISNWVAGQREKLCDLLASPAKGKARKHLEPLALLLAQVALPGEELNLRAALVMDFYYPLVKDLYPDDWPERQADLKEIMRMCESQKNLSSFLADMTLDPPNSKTSAPDVKGGGLTLSTIHSAKGLEWPKVFLLSAVEGRFPPSYGARTAEEVEEERRLLYVAITRAEDELYIMLPLGEFDRRTGMMARPSRFLAALPSDGSLAWQENGREVEAESIINQGFDDEQGYEERTPYRPKSFGSSLKIEKNSFKAALSQPSFTDLELGMKVSHPIYGAGKVLEINGGQAQIDFDHFGRKNVTIQYAKLSPL